MISTFDLTGRVAVVTGATKGMGLAIATALGQAGASLFISGQTEDSIGKAVQSLSAAGLTVKGFPLNVASAASTEAFIEQASNAYGKIDILVLNAAGDYPIGSILTHTAEQFDEVMVAGVRTNLMMVNAISPQMVARRSGSILFMSSRAAKRGSQLLGLYAMTKAATDQYVRNLALELGPSNINVNSICPGPVRTDYSRLLWENPESEAKIVAVTPLRRIGEPEDVAGLALLLSSDAGKFIHGQNISVDGGMTA